MPYEYVAVPRLFKEGQKVFVITVSKTICLTEAAVHIEQIITFVCRINLVGCLIFIRGVFCRLSEEHLDWKVARRGWAPGPY